MSFSPSAREARPSGNGRNRFWLRVSFHTRMDAPWAKANPAYFLRDASGAPVRGNWVGYVMDGTNPATFPDLLQPVYRGFRDMGYTYFKLDALRHLK